ncbi:aminodeoxychorismate synthase component I [Hyalangium sp.]|uniref:aminodeoxychorismate synthase component I n=1 Tax=Hyalangium sp. TaxID=2028555 RepID=UPI002D3F19DB|nr:aminodeoxychorismate synthase component I [Hyalangium sp.]HYI00796.1 aminodeoxychorismate synthase component I [Hyalangium sp.]
MSPHVPLHRSLRVQRLATAVTPYQALSCFTDQSYLCLLENPGQPSAQGRYSFLCANPFLVFQAHGTTCQVGPPGDLRPLPGDPSEELKKLLARYRSDSPREAEGLPPFLGGAVGYLGYELLHALESIPSPGADSLEMPDAYLLFCGAVLATDHLEGTSWVLANGFGESPEEASRRADAELKDVLRRLASLPPSEPRPGAAEYVQRRKARLALRPRLLENHLAESGIRPFIPQARYLEAIHQALEHIAAGDLFEVCLTQRFDAEHTGSGEALYRILRTVHEAPMAAYLRFPEGELLSASPERFLSLDRERWAETRPIKGTRPRGRTPEEDAVLHRELETSEKDRAENLMIVDLARNDLGRVCEFGTVRVPRLCEVETYPMTHQLVSTVRGRLRAGFDAVDLLRAAFPGGSMTGAPKIEAMKVISRLEPSRRGVYSGSIGYFDFDGGMDLSIVIRTLLKQGDRIRFHTGGAIVTDSIPEEEYQETLDKAHGLVLALELARER